MQELYINSKDEMLKLARYIYPENLRVTTDCIVEQLKMEKPEWYFYEACAWYAKEFDVRLVDVVIAMKHEDRKM